MATLPTSAGSCSRALGGGAGGHNLLSSVIPGAGKTMSPGPGGILPPLTSRKRSSAAIHSVAGPAASRPGLLTWQPFRATSTVRRRARRRRHSAWEISLRITACCFSTRCGVRCRVLEMLRRPLEKDASRSRVRPGPSPARFVLMAAMNRARVVPRRRTARMPC